MPRQLYVCDESGMPALRRRLLGLRQLPARPQVTAIVTIADASYKDYLADLDGFNIEWVVGHNPAFVAERLAQVKVPAEDYFIWLTGEGAVVKSLLARFEDESIDQQLVRSRGVLAQQVKSHRGKTRIAARRALSGLPAVPFLSGGGLRLTRPAIRRCYIAPVSAAPPGKA